MRVPVHRARAARAVAVLCVLVCCLLLVSASAQALKVHTFAGSFGGEGSGSGQFKEPGGVAVNDTTHDVYVLDRGNDRVEEFNATGSTVLGEFNGSAAPSGVLTNMVEIAIDNSTNALVDPSAGDVYVAGEAQFAGESRSVIYKFSEGGAYLGQLTAGANGVVLHQVTGMAVDPAGTLWVLEGGSSELISFSDGLENQRLSESELFGSTELAVDAEDNLYTDNNVYEGEDIEKVKSSGEVLINKIDVEPTTGIALDPVSGELYVGNVETVAAFSSSSGTPLERFGAGHLTSGSGIAVDASSGTVYVADSAADDVAVFDSIVLPEAITGAATDLTATAGDATLNGTVNPGGEALTSCQFEYGTEASYGATTPCVPTPGAGSNTEAVHANVSGLQPGTLYHFRLNAGNANGTRPGADETFIAPAAPKVDGESLTDDASTSATFSGQINPGGLDTTYRFEYGPSASYGMSAPVSGGDAGSGLGDVSVSVRPQNLQPHTTYHYRVVASNTLASEVAGADQTFTTQSAGEELALLDGRQWELVSPAIKDGAGFEPIGGEGAAIQAAESGAAMTYIASAPTEANPAGNITRVQVLSVRGAAGWSSRDVSPPQSEPPGVRGEGQEFRFFSSDLSLGVLEPIGASENLLSSEAGGRTAYLYDTSHSAYQPLVRTSNTAPGSELKGAYEHSPRFVAGSPDLSHVILSSPEALTSPRTESGLYEWTQGRLQLVNLLPESEGGEPASNASLGDESHNTRHAISDDGSRIVWRGDESQRVAHLYLRDVSKGETLRLDTVQDGPEGGTSNPIFQLANSEGSRVFFTDSQRLTAHASPEGADLYECEVIEVAGKLACKLTDLTDEHSGQSAGIQGTVLGASEDGSELYIVANAVLAPGAAQGDCFKPSGIPPPPGTTCNLYALHYDGARWTTRTVAVLSSEDERDWEAQLEHLGTVTSRVSPHGRDLAFMSDRNLTGYDNRDANSGVPDEEVYLYDSESGHLVCASCDPTGAEPVGKLDAVAAGTGGEAPLVERQKNWEDRWLAANIPGWTSEDSGGTAVYQSRYLSDSGRLFFNSFDALVPQDTNGVADVYEYEPAGIGSCAVSSVTFSESSGGCVDLLSSGASDEESAFLDASASGEDVFFLTSAQLVPQDVDTAIDVYDAHACSAAVPCSTQPPSTPACTNEDSCRPAPAPQPTIFGAPASATFSGSGNLAPPVAKPLTKAKRGKSKPKAKAKKRAKHKKRRKHAARSKSTQSLSARARRNKGRGK